MADSIVRLKVDSQEYDNKLKRAAEQLNRYADGFRKAGGTLEYLDDGVLEFTRALGSMETVSKSAKGSISEMTKAFTDLSVKYNKLTDDEKNAPFGKALSEAMDQLKGRIQEGKSELDEINKSLNGGGGLKDTLDQVAGKFGLNIDQITKFGGVVGLTTTAVKVAKDAFLNMESGIDEWGRTVEGAKGAYSIFLDTLNNGNWSNFFQNLQTAIQGGRDLYDVFDRLGSIKSNNAAAIAITQKEIAELILAKQQGENVDAKLKAATERLAALQKQSVTAGQTAGTQSAFQTVRNSVNSIGGAGVNDATIKYAVERIMKYGQSEFDKYKSNRDILYQRGMVTKTETINDSQGGTYERQYRVFNINALTKEEQKQYALAQAITEGETRIQKGIAAYAQAVSEGTSAAREQFKGNRYALQGSGGGGSRGGGGGTGVDINQLLKDSWNKASMVDGEKAMELTGPSKAWKAYVESVKQGSEDAADSIKSLEKAFESLNKAEGAEARENTAKNVKAIGESARITASMVGTIGQAFNAIEDPAAKVRGTVAQAIATVALAYADTLAKDQSSKSNVWAFIAAAAAATVSMAMTIANIHSATGYAQGGEIKGNSYSGDNIPVMVNAGEVVLTKAMAGNLASQLQSNGGGGTYQPSHISGEQIYIALNRYMRRSGRGEIVTWKS